MTSVFPPVPLTSPIRLDLAGHVYVFHRLTWAEEVRFTQAHPGGSRRAYVAYALDTLDSQTLTYEQADTLLKFLPRPVLDRVIIFYYGSLPGRRAPLADIPYVAPEPLEHLRNVTAESEDQEDAERSALDRTFGAEDVDEALALGHKMVQGTKGAGLSPVTPPAENEFKVEVW